ncbi:MAG: phosphotransferase [Actinomycetia bacterium]|nr:phosphotransferase [Actinomycetes bacterium]MCP4087291.1 phosphotransferase [Actinomycetes bacterium]
MAPLSGGDVADSYRVTLTDGPTVFAKTHAAAPPGFFVTEAKGLAWLRDAHAVPVPEVMAVSDDPAVLVLGWIEPGDRHSTTEADFGRGLAALHQAGASCFGREDRRTTGSRGLPNEPCDSWADFYASNRLLPLARLARDSGSLPESTVLDLEAVAGRLDRFGSAEPPARLHGDLWAGNRVVGEGGVSWLLDPAAHGGHREFDLAMMRLFGGFGPGCFEAYHEAYPLAVGWESRVPLHQLAPLAVHAIKFGGPFADATARALDALG